MSRADRLFGAALVLGTLAVHAGSLQAPPEYDDQVAVLRKPEVVDLSRSLASFRQPPPHRHLSELSYALQIGLGWGSLAALRLGTLLLHLGACGMVFLIARRVGGPGAFPRWAALAFALHPMGAQTAVYLSQRCVVLEALLAFLALDLFLRGTRWAYVGALLATALACMAKPTGVTVPLMLGSAAWVLGSPGRKRLLWLLPFLLAPAVFLLLPQDGTPLWIRPSWGLGPREYALEQLGVVGAYLRRAVFPFPLPFYYDRQVPLPGAPFPAPWGTALPCGALLLAAGGWILFGPGRHRIPRLGLALFLAPLALESSIFPLPDTGWNHRCYPGLLGAALVFAWAARGVLLPAAALGLLGLGALHETRLWTRPGALLQRDVRHAFHADVVWGDYGWSRLEQGDAPGAERLFLRGLQSPWWEIRLRLGLAASWAAEGRRAAARALLDSVIRDFPAEGDPYRLAIALALQEGDGARAEALARAARTATIRP